MKKNIHLLAKNDFLDMVKQAFTLAVEGVDTLSRDRAQTLWLGLMKKIEEEVGSTGFSVRGMGKFYMVYGRDKKNKYLRFKIKL